MSQFHTYVTAMLVGVMSITNNYYVRLGVTVVTPAVLVAAAPVGALQVVQVAYGIVSYGIVYHRIV